MGVFKAALINEIEKMYRRKKAMIVVIISILSIILGQLFVIGVNRGWGITVTTSTQFPIMVLSVLVSTILPLFTALAAIDAFTGEFSHNTMKIALMRPVSRFKLFTAKVTSVIFFIFINLMLVMVLSTVTGMIFSSVSISINGLWHIFISYMVTMLPITVFALLVVFFANIFKNSIAAFFMTVILFISFYGFGIAFPKYSSIFVTSMFDWYRLWIGDGISFSTILRKFLIMLGYGIMFYSAGLYIFDKKDI